VAFSRPESKGFSAYASCSVADGTDWSHSPPTFGASSEEGRQAALRFINLRDSLAGKGWSQNASTSSRDASCAARGRSSACCAGSPRSSRVPDRGRRLEQQRNRGTETPAQIDTLRNGRRMPGWVLLALGIARPRGRGADRVPRAARIWTICRRRAVGMLAGIG